MDIKDVSEQAFQRGRESVLKELETVNAELLTLRNQLRWIPVTERLPEEFVSVMVYIPGESPLQTVHEAYLAHGGIYSKLIKFDLSEITHWMPLPEPPKEVQADA